MVPLNKDNSSLEELDDLRRQNAELRRRIEVVGSELDGLRDAALERRAEIRELAESYPTAVSRRAMLSQMSHDLLHHPDKQRMAGRAFRKAGRIVSESYRSVADRLNDLGW